MKKREPKLHAIDEGTLRTRTSRQDGRLMHRAECGQYMTADMFDYEPTCKNCLRHRPKRKGKS